jgi:hypothetical protein
MSTSLSPEYFSLLILDPNKLPKNQNVKEIFDQKGPPVYCLFVNTKPFDKKIIDIDEQYELKWICDGQYCLASLKTTTYYHISKASIKAFKPTPNIYGAHICILGTDILYVPFDQCTKQEIQTMLYRADKLYSDKCNIHLICTQSNQNIKQIKKLTRWEYHKLDLQEFCLRYKMNFNILVNRRFITQHDKIPEIDLDILTQEWSNPNLNLDKRKHKTYRDRDNDINYGLLIYIADWRLNHLKKCLEVKYSQNTSKTP